MVGLMRDPEILRARNDAKSAQFGRRLKAAGAVVAFAVFAKRRPRHFTRLAS